MIRDTEGSYIEVREGSATSFVGKEAVDIFTAVALKQGLLMYGKHKIMPNRHWTPTRMLAAAGKVIGKTYKRGAYIEAACDLEEWIQVARQNVRVIDIES